MTEEEKAALRAQFKKDYPPVVYRSPEQVQEDERREDREEAMDNGWRMKE